MALNAFRRCREHGAGAAQPADDVGTVPGGALPARSQAASAADPGNGRGEYHRGIGLRPGGAALRGSRRPLLPTAAAAALGRAVGRPSSSSIESGGVTGRRGCTLQEQQHRRPEAEGEAASGGLRARQARVRPGADRGRVGASRTRTMTSMKGMKGTRMSESARR